MFDTQKMYKLEFSGEELNKIVTDFKDIEKWEGEAYHIFDEVGIAVIDMKQQIWRAMYEAQSELLPRYKD